MFKKVLTTTVLGVSALSTMMVHAAAPGIYVTGQIGYANNNMVIHNNDKIENNNIEASSLAGRFAMGYQFNQNFALEAGYFRAAQKDAILVTSKAKKGPDDVIYAHSTLDQNAIDFVAKGIVPVSTNLNLYGKLGVAYLTTDFDANSSDPRFKVVGDYIAKRKLAPEAAIGISYDITPNVSIDSSWTHIQTIGKNRPGNVDFVALGLGYNFG